MMVLSNAYPTLKSHPFGKAEADPVIEFRGGGALFEPGGLGRSPGGGPGGKAPGSS
jgi:hypothetical protein